jgi:hypothetical protein
MELLLPVGGLLEFLSGINLKYSANPADPKGNQGCVNARRCRLDLVVGKWWLCEIHDQPD